MREKNSTQLNGKYRNAVKSGFKKPLESCTRFVDSLLSRRVCEHFFSISNDFQQVFSNCKTTEEFTSGLDWHLEFQKRKIFLQCLLTLVAKMHILFFAEKPFVNGKCLSYSIVTFTFRWGKKNVYKESLKR